MDKSLLAKIAKQNPTARAMFEHFRTRERNPKDGMMDLRRTKYALRDEGVEVVPEEFIANFKALERAGVGKLIMEKGKPARFKWAVNMKDAASVVDEAPESPGLTHAKGNGHLTGVTEVVAALGRDRDAVMSLPNDLTDSEAEFLCSIVRKKIKR